MICIIAKAINTTFNDKHHSNQYLQNLFDKKITDNRSKAHPIETYSSKLLTLVILYLWAKEPAKDNLPVFDRDKAGSIVYFTEEQFLDELKTGKHKSNKGNDLKTLEKLSKKTDSPRS